MAREERGLSFQVAEQAAAKVELQSAVLIYGAAGGSNAAFATVHAIHRNEHGAVTILPGKPMTALAVARLARRLSKRARGGFVPPNLLYQDVGGIAWWVPPARRQIWFRSDPDKLGASERGEVVPHPGLVFAVSTSGSWRLWALRGSERPGPDTPLFKAPYFNCYEGGGICVGNVEVPGSAAVDKIAAWQAAFFGSWFTHPNVHDGLVNYRGGAYKFWRDMLDGRHPEFPEHVLVPNGKTLREVLCDRRQHDA